MSSVLKKEKSKIKEKAASPQTKFTAEEIGDLDISKESNVTIFPRDKNCQ